MTDRVPAAPGARIGVIVPVMSSVRLAEPTTPEATPAGTARRADLIAVGLAMIVVAAAVAVGLYYNRPDSGVVIFAFAPPLFGDWLPHAGPGSVAAVLVALGVVA